MKKEEIKQIPKATAQSYPELQPQVPPKTAQENVDKGDCVGAASSAQMTKKCRKLMLGKTIEQVQSMLSRIEKMETEARQLVLSKIEPLFVNLNKSKHPFDYSVAQLNKNLEKWMPNVQKAKPEGAPSQKPPKGWWEEKVSEVKQGNPGYSQEQVNATVGSIWSGMSRGQKASRRHSEGKKYGKAPSSK